MFLKKNLPLILNIGIFLLLFYRTFSFILGKINTYIIGIEGDSSYYLWIIQWFSQFFKHSDNLLITSAFYPIGIDISAGWEGSIVFYLGSILNFFFSPIISYNLIILIPFFLNWICGYFFFSQLSKEKLFSGLISSFFCFSSFFLLRTFGHPTYLYFFPIIILFYFLNPNILKKLNRKQTIFFILNFSIISTVSWYYFIFSCLIVFLFFLISFFQNKKFLLQNWRNLLSIFLASFSLIVLLNLPMFKAFFIGSEYFYPYPFKMDNKELNKEFSLTILDYIKPQKINYLFSEIKFGNSSIEKGTYLGILPLIYLPILIFFLMQYKNKFQQKKMYILLTIVFLALSFGTNLPLSLYEALTSLPIINRIHSPARFGIIVLFLFWIMIAQSIKIIQTRKKFIVIFAIFCIIQTLESSYYLIAFTDYSDRISIEKLKNKSQSPILEIPVPANNQNSATLIIPALTGRPIFSGYPQHTTYSPQIVEIINNNLFENLKDKQERNIEDIIINGKLREEEVLFYLKEKYNLKDIVVNKDFKLNNFNTNLIKLTTASEENNQYAFYEIDQRTNLPLNDSVKIILQKGFGEFLEGERTARNKIYFDLINFSQEEKKVSIFIHFIDMKGGTKDIKINRITKPGINPLYYQLSKEKCYIRGADCIAGFINKIELREEK